MRRHAPHHSYHTTSQLSGDLWHLFTPYLSTTLLLRSSRSIVTLPDIYFIKYPHLYSSVERYILHPIAMESIRSAVKLIARCPISKSLLVDKLQIEPERVVVSPSIISHLSPTSRVSDCSSPLSNEEMMSVRSKYELPQSFILSMGELDTRHGQAALITTIVERGIPLDVVMVSRHTSHADEILAYARRKKVATRVHILYEAAPREVKALYSMAMGVVYTPLEGASIEPIIDSLRAGCVMMLSDTRINREAARGAAIYLDSLRSDDIANALRTLLYDVSYRDQMCAQSISEAKRFSEEGVAQELASIYDGV